MNIEQAFEIIESLDFAVKLGLASGYKLFLQFANEQEAVSYLLSLSSEKIAMQIAEHIQKLLTKEYDVNYEHPYDTALTVYLYVLQHKNLVLAKTIATEVSKIPNCSWWLLKTIDVIFAQEVPSEDLNNVQN